MKYKTVQASNSTDLDKKVQDLLDSGWELHGFPYITGNTLNQCVVSGIERQSEGLTVDDIATLSLLRRGFGPRRW